MTKGMHKKQEHRPLQRHKHAIANQRLDFKAWVKISHLLIWVWCEMSYVVIGIDVILCLPQQKTMPGLLVLLLVTGVFLFLCQHYSIILQLAPNVVFLGTNGIKGVVLEAQRC